MTEKRMNLKRKAKLSVAEKSEITFDQWRFYLLWGIVLFCFVVLVIRAFYVQVINRDFLQNKANALILRDETIRAIS